MKNTQKIYVVILLCSLIFQCNSHDSNPSFVTEDQIIIRVNPTIELVSTISRLAGIKQYDEKLLPDYLDEFEDYFGHLKDHPTVMFSKEINEQFDINGSAPMALAVYLGPPPTLEPLVDLSSLPKELDPRWDSTLIFDFLEKARAFAIESNFMEFYNGHIEFHEKSCNNLEKMLNKERISLWYKEFFGYYPDNFIIQIALLNGSCCYGFPVTLDNGEKEFISLLGARFPHWWNKSPTYSKDLYLPVIIHEYCHSYINPLTKNRPEEFMELGEELLISHRKKMIEHGYNVWNVILNEYIVRACTIHFIAQHEGEKKASTKIQSDEMAGFPAIRGLVKLLDNYLENRSEYPDIESFLPQIKIYFESYLTEIKKNDSL